MNFVESENVRIIKRFIKDHDVDSCLYACDVIVVCSKSHHKAIESVRYIRTKAQKPLIVAADATVHAIATILDSGADDCVSSKCKSVEMQARCRSLVRRCADPLFFTTEISQGEVSVDLQSKDVVIFHKPCILTKTEYRLLYQLLLHARKIVPKSKLETCLKNHRSKSAMHRVDMHIMNLRRKTKKKIDIETISRHGLKLHI